MPSIAVSTEALATVKQRHPAAMFLQQLLHPARQQIIGDLRLVFRAIIQDRFAV
jgi:hypothetical protein